MRLLRFLLYMGLVAALFVPGAAWGAVTALTESEMDAITGQAGVRIEVDDFDFGTDIKNVYFGDDESGWLSVNDIVMNGSVRFETPMVVETTTAFNPMEGREMDVVKMTISDMNIRMDEFSIGSITLGPNKGEGPSFGSIGMTGFHARISGNVRIWAH